MKIITLLIIMLSFFTKGNARYDQLVTDFSFKSVEGNTINLADYKDKVILVVNVASRCGFTNQYEGLQTLWSEYKDKGLVELISLVNNYTKIYQQVTGVPSNLSINEDNLDYYLKSERASFPLGIVIHDLSLLNLQVQRLHTGLLQYYKGKVS